MKHYFRLVIGVFLLAVTTVVFPIGLLTKIVSRVFGDYLSWLVITHEKWVKELEDSL